MRSLAWLAIGMIGCGDNLTVSTTTRTQVIPSVQGDRAAFVLEPLQVGNGVITEKAPAVLIDLDTNEEIDTFVVGMTRVVLGDSQAWVLQSNFAEWRGEQIGSEPMSRQAANMAIVDRNTLQVTSQAVLDPPIDTPIVIGDELFDVSHEPNAGNNLVIRLRNADGTAQRIAVEPQATNPAWCSSPGHLVYAFDEDFALGILDVRRGPQKWYWTRTEIPTAKLQDGGIACDRLGARIALDIKENEHGPSVLVLDLATGQRTYFPGLGAPLAIEADGNAVIAQRTDDSRLVRATATSTTELPLYVDAATTKRPLIVGSQALFTSRTEFRIVDLTTAAVSPAIDVSLDGVRVIPWSDANGFAVMRYRGDELTGLGVASASGGTMMTLPPLVRDPELISAAGARMYISTSNDKRDLRQVFGFERARAEPVSSATPPECNPGALTLGRCR